MSKTLLAAAAAAVLTGALSLPAQAQNVAIVNGKPVPKARLDALEAQIKAQAARTGQPIPQNDDGGQYANASQEVAEKVKSHRAANTKASYEEAMRAVLTADPALQQRYVEFTQRSGRAN